MNLTSSIIVPVAFLASFSSSSLIKYNMPNYSLPSIYGISDTQRTIRLNEQSAWDIASSLFPELRSFSKEESRIYEENLSKLFKKTGKTLF